MDEWVTVVEPALRSDAKRLLEQGLAKETSAGRSYSENEIREDLVLCGDRQCRVRYCVRAKK